MDSSSNILFASLFWGSVGAGYCIYGRKQRSWPAMAGGAAMIGVSYVTDSVLLMSAAAIVLMTAVYLLIRHGH